MRCPLRLKTIQLLARPSRPQGKQESKDWVNTVPTSTVQCEGSEPLCCSCAKAEGILWEQKSRSPKVPEMR